VYKIGICRLAVFSSSEHSILNYFCLKVKVKVDMSKLTFKLVFPYNYFQILRQKNPNPFIWKTLKFDRETIIWTSYTGHSNIWGKSGSVVWRFFFFSRAFDFEFLFVLKLKLKLIC
jgi:hypothetical protein